MYLTRRARRALDRQTGSTVMEDPTNNTRDTPATARPWGATLLNQLCVAAWLAGVSDRRIARWRAAGGRSPVAAPAAIPQQF